MEVFFSGTPNGWKVSIMLEELKAAGADVDWTVTDVNVRPLPPPPRPPAHPPPVGAQLGEGDQFTEEFKAVNPNSKMPALRDGELCLFESGNILHYLAEKFGGMFLPADPAKKWECLSWLHWQMANVGPMFGNRLTYIRYLPASGEDHPHPQERFGKEARRLAEVLEDQLEREQAAGNGEFICGEYTIVDMAVYPWLRGWKWSKVDLTGDRTGATPAPSPTAPPHTTPGLNAADQTAAG